MRIKLLIDICRQASHFEFRYPKDGETYLHLAWKKDGHELYIRKPDNCREHCLLKKSQLKQIIAKKQTGFLCGIIVGALSIPRPKSQDIVPKNISVLLQIEHDIIFRRDGSFTVLK